MNDALSLRGISKTFGSTVAVRDMDLTVPRGGVYGFIGPNGAGKTTCIRMIMSILFPDAGELSVLGRGSALEAKDRIGYLPEERGVYRRMRVGAFLTYMGRLKGLPGAEASRRSRRLLERVGLPETERKRCQDLSKGMLQRVQIAAAVIHEPELLILDEPFSGLDPVSVRKLREIVTEEHRRGATILFSTHAMSQVEDFCQQVVMIHRGRKVLDEPTSSLRRRFDPRLVRLEPLSPDADLSAIASHPEIERVDRTDAGYDVRLVPNVAPGAAIQMLAGMIDCARIELARLTLEDIFIDLVSERHEEAEALRASLAPADLTGAAV